MSYRAIATGCEVSPVGLGGNVFGYACDAKQTEEILSAALELGVNFVDTADVYSNGVSEKFIGNALRGCRDRWIVASKVGIPTGANGNRSGSRKTIHARIEGTLRRLQTEYVDLYQLHHFDPTTPVEETLGALAELQRAGKIRFFGISNCTAAQVARYLAVAGSLGVSPPVTHQVHYNLLKRDAEKIATTSSPQLPRTLAYGVLGRGVLSGKYRDAGQPLPNTRAAASPRVRSDLQPTVLAAVEQMSKLAGAAGLTMPQLALRYVLRRRNVASSLVGVRNVRQLQELTDGCRIAASEELWHAVEKLLEELGRFENVSLGQPMLNVA